MKNDIKLAIKEEKKKITFTKILEDIRSSGHEAWMEEIEFRRKYESANRIMRDKIRYYKELVEEGRLIIDTR